MCAQPTWQQLINACLRQEATTSSLFLQLASLTVSGEPSCRTVVFRGWHQTNSDPTPSLLIATDGRSAKINGLLKYPKVEACWYFLKARVQFRLTSHVVCIRNDEQDADLINVRSELWRELLPPARQHYATLHPGHPLEKNFSAEQEAQVVNSENPVECFAVLMLRPERVDVVDLRANNRRLYELNDDHSWAERFVNR
ncbi:unnamed protein product [Agarophyton chilense]